MDYPKIIAVDFDGTLAENAWPGIGAPIQSTINALKAEQDAGCITILWTNRCGERLKEAEAWCAEQGIKLDYVNANTPEMIEFFGNDCRKVFANEYWDDRAKVMPERTCRIRIEVSVDECEYGPVVGRYPFCESCGFDFYDEGLSSDCCNNDCVREGINYCPSCGARIEREEIQDNE